MSVYEYFESVQRGIKQDRKIGYLEEPVMVEFFDAHRGSFYCRVFFWDGSRLTIAETVDTRQGYPHKTDYAYTYVNKEGQHVFRYDNAPHHPDLDNFPHHKHVGPSERPISAEQPTLSQIFAEIETYLSDSEPTS